MKIVKYEILTTADDFSKEFDSLKEAIIHAEKLDKRGDGFLVFCLTGCGQKLLMEY